MSMETFICPKCKRQGCFIEDEEPAHEQDASEYPDTILKDWTCKCGHTITVEERAPLPEARGAEEAVAVMLAVRSLRQDVRPYMRHMEDCDLVKYREGTYLPPRTIHDVPPCSCGLEKVLWDIPAENETGRTK